ncbi:MAG: YybH family protein [Gemmatimonadota bacterium]
MTAGDERAAVETEIRAIVDRETRAWDERDAEALVELFHPDMVWPWPPGPRDHDPKDWVMEWGRYDRERWRAGWQRLFDTHDLVRNERTTRKIVVSEQGDGAFAVVDIDTVWRHHETGDDFPWTGRTCKIYTRTDDGWKMIFQTGALAYSPRDGHAATEETG